MKYFTYYYLNSLQKSSKNGFPARLISNSAGTLSQDPSPSVVKHQLDKRCVDA